MSDTNTETIHEAEVVHDDTNGKRPARKRGSTAIAKRDATQIATQDAPASPQRITIEDMIMKALEMDKPELIDKFTAIYEKQEAERKKTAYTAAMARAQARMLPVANNAINTHTHSRYAKLAAINRMAAPIYGEEGLAVSFKTGKAEREGDYRTIGIVSHKDGYMTTDEDFYIDLPLDNSGIEGRTNKTQLHARKSTNTYAKNILVCSIFNISTEDDTSDDDGNGGGGITPRNARAEKARQAAVKQPREKGGSQNSGEIKPFSERPQIEPVSESGDGINQATAKGYMKAIVRAFSDYGEQAKDIGWAEFRKRFPRIELLSQVPNTPEAQKIVMAWIADPTRN